MFGQIKLTKQSGRKMFVTTEEGDECVQELTLEVPDLS